MREIVVRNHQKYVVHTDVHALYRTNNTVNIYKSIIKNYVTHMHISFYTSLLCQVSLEIYTFTVQHQ